MRLRRIALLAGTAVSATALSLATATSASATATAGHMWNATNSASAECLSISGGYITGHAIMWSCDGESSENWQIGNDGGLIQVFNPGGYAIGVANQNNGAWVGAGPGYSWSSFYTAIYQGGGYYELQDYQDHKRCLSVAGGSGANGANVIEWTCNGTPDQLWHADGGWG